VAPEHPVRANRGRATGPGVHATPSQLTDQTDHRTSRCLAHPGVMSYIRAVKRNIRFMPGTTPYWMTHLLSSQPAAVVFLLRRRLLARPLLP